MKPTHPISVSEVLVTTRPSPCADDVSAARELSVRLGCRFASRKSHSVSRLVRIEDASAALVAGGGNLHFVFDGRRYGFHPNMALQRLKALKQGQQDRLVEAAGLQPGDKFLDCTCGMGADAIVAAYAVGAQGCVTALEDSPLLSVIIESGLSRYGIGDIELMEAMRRVRIENRSCQEVLPRLESDSWDVVYFDPMFDEGFRDSESLDLVRLLGRPGLPAAETVDEAKRVARRCVIIKDRAPGVFLKHAGVRVVSDSKRVWYGRLDAG